MKKISKRESTIMQLVKFVHGRPIEEKKKITYAYFEKKEYEKKTKLTKAVKNIANKNIRLLPQFREKYPEYNKSA